MMAVEVKLLSEWDDGSPNSYYCDGHVEKEEFIAGLDYEWELTCDESAVRHAYHHFVPTPQEDWVGMLVEKATPGRGNKKVTVVDVSDCRETTQCP